MNDSEKELLIISSKANKEHWGVHESHCCPKHGCKYGDADCPVVLGLTEKYNEDCMDCEDDEEHPDPLSLLEAWVEFDDCGGDVSPAVSNKDISECDSYDIVSGMIKMIREHPSVVIEIGKKQGWWPRK